jgi:hypothetical protein
MVTKSLHTDASNELTTNWKANIKEDKDEAATKHDDAAVPIIFWNEALPRKLKQSLSKLEEDTIDKLRWW